MHYIASTDSDFVESEVLRNLIAIAENKLKFRRKTFLDAISEPVNFKIFLKRHIPKPFWQLWCSYSTSQLFILLGVITKIRSAL